MADIIQLLPDHVANQIVAIVKNTIGRSELIVVIIVLLKNLQPSLRNA